MLTQGRGEMPLYAPTYRAHAHRCPYTSANAPIRAGEQCPENAPIRPAGETTRLSLIFLVLNKYIYTPYPQNAPIRRGTKCPYMPPEMPLYARVK